MEKAIKKSIEGGWNGEKRQHAGRYVDYRNGNNPEIFDHFEIDFTMDLSHMLLDPLFWQALGKACGWGQNEVNHDVLKMKDGVCCECLKEGEYKCYFCKFTFCEEHSQTHFGSKNTQVPNCMGGKGEMTSSWVYNWHRFIDHLAEGKDADSYFDNLLK